MPLINTRSPGPIERVVAALCYFSFGLVGVLYIIVSGRGSQSTFFRFHFLQGIVIGIFAYLLGWTGSAVQSILLGVFSLFAGSGGSSLSTINATIDVSVAILAKLCYLLVLYGSISALFGKYAEIPFLSPLVRRQM